MTTEEKLQFIKASANTVGLKLMGDGFIGYQFVPRCGLSEWLDDFLKALADEDSFEFHKWCVEHRDLPYESNEWNRHAEPVSEPRYTVEEFLAHLQLIEPGGLAEWGPYGIESWDQEKLDAHFEAMKKGGR